MLTACQSPAQPVRKRIENTLLQRFGDFRSGFRLDERGTSLDT
jgi:hypothetical protein